MVDMLGGQDWSIVIVIKKNNRHIDHLIGHIEELRGRDVQRGQVIRIGVPCDDVDDGLTMPARTSKRRLAASRRYTIAYAD